MIERGECGVNVVTHFFSCGGLLVVVSRVGPVTLTFFRCFQKELLLECRPFNTMDCTLYFFERCAEMIRRSWSCVTAFGGFVFFVW
jgi:hypothetical protein